jgi:hypothetical protein
LTSVDEVDSKAVNTRLRGQVRPLLKAAGFRKFTDRNSWRTGPASRWVVNFGSFNSYLAEGIGCTTFSFGINLGVYFDCHRPSPDAPPIEWPKEPEGTIRFRALKTLQQPFFNPYGKHPGRDRRDVFFVLDDGSNLDEVIDDACEVLASHALPTLHLYDDPLYAYCALFDHARRWPPRSPSPQVEVLPCGSVGSPHWREVVLALGQRLGRDPRAEIEAGLDEDLIDSVLQLR